MSSVNYTLSTLVASTPHLLAYAIPLLLLSALFTVAGTFLTLDRSRSFPPSHNAVPLPGNFDGLKEKSKLTWSLQGGIGGLVSGYLIGLHTATFLALLIPAITPSAPLTPNSFLAVWILSAIPMSFLGGRYKYSALVFSAISGGVLSALGLSVIIHPPLLPRQVLAVLFSFILLALIFIFSLPRLSRFLRPTVRAATSAAGAFSMALAIALLAKIPAWADVWERLWLHDGESWGTSKEKGISAAFCIFVSVGACTDWMLNRWLGECPDEKWDSFLANYTASLPNDASRAGSFKPFAPGSFWDRLFHHPLKNDKSDIMFPPSPLSAYKQPRGSMAKDATSLLPHTYDDEYAKFSLDSTSGPSYDLPILPSSPGFLRKSRSQRMFSPTKKTSKKGVSSEGRKRIKFGDLSSDSSDSEAGMGNGRPWLQKTSLTSSSSTPTLVNDTQPVDLELEQTNLRNWRLKSSAERGSPDYSDYEDDMASSRASKRERNGQEAGWSPGFMKRQMTASTSTGDRASAGGINSHNITLPMGAVPATPSLIKALDRISVAQQDAFGPGRRSMSPMRLQTPWDPSGDVYRSTDVVKGKGKADRMPQVRELASSDDEDGQRMLKEREMRAPRWEEFWRDVRSKAES